MTEAHDVDMRGRALALINKGFTVWAAAQALGVTRTQVSEWLLTTRRACRMPTASGKPCGIETLGGRPCHWHGGDRG